MDYYIIRDNKRQGPFSIEYLKEMGISAETKVWHEGLAAWTRAREIPELASFAMPEMPPIDEPTQDKGAGKEDIPDMPKTWLAESIIVTLLCCLVFGIIGIIYATQVESNYLSGNYKMAERKSQQARSMVLWGVGIGVALIAAYIAFLLIASLAGA